VNDPFPLHELINPQPIRPAAGTCLPFALGLTERLEFYDLSNRVRVAAASHFVRWLHHNGHLGQQEEIGDRCLVLYFIGDHNQEVWKHAGVGDGSNRVISKWGDGLVLRHPIDQAPSDYGFTVRAYEHPGSHRAMQLFRDFVDDCDQLPPWARPT
jgi:hypothetical protein